MQNLIPIRHITAGLRNSTSIQYQDVFKASTDTIAQKAETLCADELGNLFGAEMQVYAHNHILGWLSSYPSILQQFLLLIIFLTKDSQPLQKNNNTIIIYQGTLDSVPKLATDLPYIMHVQLVHLFQILTIELIIGIMEQLTGLH
jgi:hypothetical protein